MANEDRITGFDYGDSDPQNPGELTRAEYSKSFVDFT